MGFGCFDGVFGCFHGVFGWTPPNKSLGLSQGGTFVGMSVRNRIENVSKFAWLLESVFRHSGPPNWRPNASEIDEKFLSKGMLVSI